MQFSTSAETEGRHQKMHQNSFTILTPARINWADYHSFITGQRATNVRNPQVIDKREAQIRIAQKKGKKNKSARALFSVNQKAVKGDSQKRLNSITDQKTGH